MGCFAFPCLRSALIFTFNLFFSLSTSLVYIQLRATFGASNSSSVLSRSFLRDLIADNEGADCSTNLATDYNPISVHLSRINLN